MTPAQLKLLLAIIAAPDGYVEVGAEGHPTRTADVLLEKGLIAQTWPEEYQNPGLFFVRLVTPGEAELTLAVVDKKTYNRK